MSKRIGVPLQQQLRDWYLENARPLPWRQTTDPYRIWISEVMLQQTTATAVIPYYERFIKKFPDLKTLANANLENVLEQWAGLGYYSRARNLHKAAKELSKIPFPQTFGELILFKGFGPYTARAVSSFAFKESVGVLDGNVIRILCRFYGLKSNWWNQKERARLQTLADQWVKNEDSSVMNNAMMELGATLCSPKSPSCLLCPIRPSCIAFKAQTVDQLPLPKPRKSKELWQWSPRLLVYKNQLALVKNDYAPFLKGQDLLPGKALRLKRPPKTFDYKHNVTHYEIYVQTRLEKIKSVGKIPKRNVRWVPILEAKKHTPLALIQKAISLHFSSEN